MEFKSVSVKILAKDCESADYYDGGDCPLARAIKRVIKPEFYTRFTVGGCGHVTWDQLSQSRVLKFDYDIVMAAKKDFYRKLEIPKNWLIGKQLKSAIKVQIAELQAKINELIKQL